MSDKRLQNMQYGKSKPHQQLSLCSPRSTDLSGRVVEELASARLVLGRAPRSRDRDRGGPLQLLRLLGGRHVHKQRASEN